MAESILVQISFTMDGVPQRILLDTVEATQITTSSTITTHPLTNGDIVADHMYKNPIILQLNGSFALSNNGSQQVYYKNLNRTLQSQLISTTNMMTVEALFERIKNEAILCDIVKLSKRIASVTPSSTQNASDIERGYRFQERKNMALTNISWTENISTLGFSFQFNQVTFAKLQSTPIKTVYKDVSTQQTQSESTYLDTSDSQLPVVANGEQVGSYMNSPLSVNEWASTELITAQVLKDKSYMSDDYYKKLIAGTYIASIGAGAGGAILVSKIATTLGLSASAAGPAGLIIAGAVAATGITVMIVKILKEQKNAEKIYKDFQSQKDMFDKFTDELHKELKNIDNWFTVYKITLNKPHQVYVSMKEFAGDDLTCTFTKETEGSPYKIMIKTKYTNERILDKSDISSYAASSFYDAKGKQLYSVTNKGVPGLYLIKPDPTSNTHDLTNYFLLKSTISHEDYSAKVRQAVINALKYYK